MRPVIRGDVNVMGAVLFGGASQALREHLRRENQELLATATPSWGQRAVERAKFLYESYNGAAAIQMVQTALNQVNSISQPDDIYEFRTIEQFQTAQSKMQNYILANPVVRERYHKGLCDGYSDTHVDERPGVIGLGHPAYEQVMNGIVQFEGEGKDVSATYTNYSGAWLTAESEVLSAHQKAAVLNTWSHLERIFAEEDRDPTSPWNGSL